MNNQTVLTRFGKDLIEMKDIERELCELLLQYGYIQEHTVTVVEGDVINTYLIKMCGQLYIVVINDETYRYMGKI